MKKPTDIVTRLCQRWQVNLPEVAIVRALSSAFPELPQLAPPVQLRPLSLKRNITGFVISPLDVDGKISINRDGTFTVHVNSNHPKTRRRFTWAHEIGHTFFLELECITSHARMRMRDQQVEYIPRGRNEEYLCNVAASEILMPFSQYASHLNRLGIGVNPLMNLSSTFKVSLHAAARRMVQLSSFKLVVVLWKHIPLRNCFQSVWEARSKLRVTSKDPLILTRGDPLYNWLVQEKPFSQYVWTFLRGPMDKYFVDGVPLDTSPERQVLTVFILDVRAPMLVSKPTKPVRLVEQPSLF